MRLKRTSHRPTAIDASSASNFHESLRVEYRRSDCVSLPALQKHFAHFGFIHQIDIPLPIAQLDVSQP